MNNALCVEPAIRHFRITGSPVSCAEFGSGHINLTYKVNCDDGSAYILQRINQYVFTDPKAVMENVGAVTEYLRTRVSDPSEILHFVSSDTGTYYYVDEAGEYWRCYEFADGLCLDLPESDKDFYESAIAFGRFQEMLRDFPAETLHETIPLFHNTANRYRLFRKALQEDRVGRAASVQSEIDFLLQRQEEGATICRLLDAGEIPLRVTHNDTKINNVLFTPEGHEAMIVIDLDTVMPGLIGHDFGDAIRFAANFAEEDCRSPEKAGVNLEVFRAFAEGFLSMTAKAMTDTEVKTLAMSCFALTAELATRFLADYLDGDLYFNIKCPDHNLIRTRCQIALAKDMRKHMDEMEQIVRDCVSKWR